MAEILLECVDPSGITVEPTGLWAVRSPAVAFGAEASSADETPVWRVNLPEDSMAAAQALDQAERRLGIVQQALTCAEGQLEEYLQRFAQDGEEQVAFAVPEAGTPEAALTILLDAYSLTVTGRVSFDIQEEVSGALEEAKKRFTDFLQSVQREVLHFAWVETQVEGKTIARTIVGWSGDSETFYEAGITAEQSAQHVRSLWLASASRALKLQMFTTVAAAAVKIVPLLASGGGTVLALPMAYQYISRFLAQVQEYQALQQSS